MEIQSKPQEVIQSQIAAFTAEKVPNYADRKYILGNITSLSKDNPESVKRITPEGFMGSTAGIERLIATNEEYLQYLRSVYGGKHEAIGGRTDILTAYGQFEPEIKQLMAELEDPEKRVDHPQFLDSGSNSLVFKTASNGKEYAVRTPKGRSTNPLAIDDHIAGAILAKGIPHLEQIVAASYENGVTISEVMPGKTMGNLTEDEIRGITDVQLAEGVDTLITANKKGIMIDPKPSNFFYDREDGFGIVDFTSSKDIGGNIQELGAVVGWLAPVIANAGVYGRGSSYKSAEEYGVALNFFRANLDVLKRLKPIVESKLNGADSTKALAGIDARIESVGKTIHDYSDIGLISERLKQDQMQNQNFQEHPVKIDDQGNVKLDVDLVN